MDGRSPRPQDAPRMPFRPKHRPKDRVKDRPRAGDKPGATHEQVERRERFQRAQRESLQPSEDTTVLYGWHPVTAALQNPARRGPHVPATRNPPPPPPAP